MDIEAIRERLAAATPGPWAQTPGHATVWAAPVRFVAGTAERKPGTIEDLANAAFIAHAPADVAALLAAHDDAAAQLAACQADNARLRAALEEYADQTNWDHFDMFAVRWDGEGLGIDIARAALAASASNAERGAALLAAERERDELRAIIALIDRKVPVADDTCDEPGITISEAARRQLRIEAAD